MTKGHGEPGRDAPEREELQKLMTRWGTLPVPVASREVLDQRHQRGLSTLRASIGSAKRERQARRMRLFLGVAAAAAFAIWGGVHVLSSSSEGPLFANATGTTPRAFVDGACEVSQGQAGWVRSIPGRSVGAGDRVRALNEPVSVRLDRITSAHVAPASVLGITTLAARRQELRLLSGTAEFEVDPKRAAEVVVRTDSALILVTGTAFSVMTGGANADSWSEVVVTRGRVQITSRGEAFVVGAGEAWSSRDVESAPSSTASANLRPTLTQAPRSDAPAQDTANLEPSPERAESERDDSTRAGSARAVSARAVSARADARNEEDAGELGTTLSEENRLFRAALSARNGGNDARCVALLGDLLTKFPSSPLRQEAMVAQFRCLRSSGNVATAQRTAQRYLSEYPKGFARDEARELVLGVQP